MRIFAVNWHKSEAMPVSQACSHNLIVGFNFQWVDKGMKCLGNELNPNIEDIMANSMGKLINKINTILNWDKIR